MNIYYKKLKEINFICLATKEMEEEFCVSSEVLAQELCRYLGMIAIHNGLLAPSRAVDAMYHALLEHPMLRKEVEDIVGGRLIHNPGIDGEELEKIYTESLEIYRKEYIDSGDVTKKENTNLWF